MYERDIRHIVARGTHQEASDRLAAFKRGWVDGVKGKTYSEQALSRVTWHNLGCEFGKALGPTEDAKQQKVFDILAALQIADRSDETDLHEPE